MQLIVITPPCEIDIAEYAFYEYMFEKGLFSLHLRKPGISEESMRAILRNIPTKWHSKIVIHSHAHLISEFNLKGWHLNGPNKHYEGVISVPYSASSHTLQELKGLKERVNGYCFLSPIFDSISKKGYQSAFTKKELNKASESDIINAMVFALGGISTDNVTDCKEFKFGGVALLGAIWGSEASPYSPAERQSRFDSFQKLCKSI